MKTHKLVLSSVLVVIALLALHIQPVAASGTFTTISFPGCDILLSGGTVNISDGDVHVVVKQGSKVLWDNTRPIAGGQLTQFTIHFVDFAKPTGTSLSVRVEVNDTVIASLSGQYPTACFNPDSSMTLRSDGRVNPAPSDRMAIWCNKDQHTLDVWGIDNESRGFRLAIFTAKELTAAGPDGVTRSTRGLGAVSAAMDSQGNIWVAWNGGPFGANGSGSFGKALNCHFGS